MVVVVVGYIGRTWVSEITLPRFLNAGRPWEGKLPGVIRFVWILHL